MNAMAAGAHAGQQWPYPGTSISSGTSLRQSQQGLSYADAGSSPYTWAMWRVVRGKIGGGLR